MILVAIDDEAGQKISLAIDQSIALPPRKEALSALQSRCKASMKEVAIDDLTPLGQEAHCDEGAWIDVSTPDEPAPVGIHVDEGAGLVGPQVRGDLIAEHPWMAKQEPALVSFVNVNRGDLLAHDALILLSRSTDIAH
jgi:hypothetical protein